MSAITTIGLYNLNKNLFDDFQIPSELDKDALVNNILRVTGNLEVFYTDADFMKDAIKYWSTSRVQTWQKIADVLFNDYEPFVNIKRDEVRTITEVRDLASTAESEGNSSESAAAWNETQPVERSKTSNGASGSSTDTGTITTTEHFHVEGDSAITDAQDVLKKEIDVRQKYNLYNIITDEFKKEFCILVY